MSFSLRRAGKWVAVVAVVAATLTAAARFGISRYLASARGKSMVADRLGSAIGMPVEVSELEVGDDSSSFRFRIMDPADPKSEVLAVRSASADVSVADLVTGRVSPSTVNLSGAALTLRVGPDGQMLTTLPVMPGMYGPFPEVAIDDGRVCVRREGRPDFEVNGITIRMAPSGNVVAVSGRIDDPRWGVWTIRGELRRTHTRAGWRAGWLELSTDDAPLDAGTLDTLPFAPPGLFDRVQSSGRANATVRVVFGYDRNLQPVMEIHPRAAGVVLPDAGLTLTAVAGLVRVSGAQVEIVGLKANVAGGSVTLDGKCPLSGSTPTAQLAVTAQDLDAKQLPPEWGLPPDVEGKLDGTAALQLVIGRGGRVEPYGTGTVIVGDYKLFGVPLGTPFRLYGDGDRLRFEPVR
jgi:hypothetical protein